MLLLQAEAAAPPKFPRSRSRADSGDEQDMSDRSRLGLGILSARTVVGKCMWHLHRGRVIPALAAWEFCFVFVVECWMQASRTRVRGVGCLCHFCLFPL